MQLRSQQRGFTLVEILVAMSIFSIIGLIGWSMLSNATTYSEQMEAASDELFEVQKAVWLISRDLQQVAHRPIRNAVGETDESITSLIPGELLSFTHYQDNSLPGYPRVQLQRISYRLAANENSETGGQALYRDIWPVLDRGAQSQPQPQLLLQGVGSVSFRFIDSSGQNSAYWPPAAEEQSPLDNLPAAVYILLESSRYGKIERLVPISAVSGNQ